MKITVTADIADVLERVYAESAWRAAHNPGALVLTPDNARLLTTHARRAWDDLLARLAGYVAASNFNPNIDQSLTLVLKLAANAPDTLPAALTGAVVATLAFYVLDQMYASDPESWFGIAWRRHRAQCVLLLARAEASTFLS